MRPKSCYLALSSLVTAISEQDSSLVKSTKVLDSSLFLRGCPLKCITVLLVLMSFAASTSSRVLASSTMMSFLLVAFPMVTLIIVFFLLVRFSKGNYVDLFRYLFFESSGSFCSDSNLLGE